MVKVEYVDILRPQLADAFDPGAFSARTPAIADAYQWGKALHAGQTRLSGEPYFETHCAWVASHIDKLVQQEAWTIAALLHDAVEDSGESLDRIRERFPGQLGEEVAHIVDGVTKLSRPLDGRSRELETLRKIAMFRDPGVFLVKLADKSHNLMTLEHMNPEKRFQKAKEAISAYGKLAGILNCYSWRRWLEDMAFPYVDPEAYQATKRKLDNDPRMDPTFINPMMDNLAGIMERAGISGRVQVVVDGYWQSWFKLRQRARARLTSMNNFVDVNDVISFRMIVEENNPDLCYTLLGRVDRFLGPYLDDSRFDDFIADPKNDYRALQVTAYLPDYGAIEVAIATEDMEGENTWGIVYCIQQGKDISRYRPVEILTPTGGARFLPEGSTVLDAVVSIQQELLLDKISAVEVNGRLAKLSEKIHPGDVVEVITSTKRLKPTREWLNFANPSTTRRLRAVLATEALKQSEEQGHEAARPVLMARGILELKDVLALEKDKFDILLGQLACASLTDLYVAIGGGAVPLEQLARALDDAGITGKDLNWTTIQIVGCPETHRPGVLAQLAGMISRAGGNILRSVNDTLPDGGFMVRLVVRSLDEEALENLRESFDKLDIEFDVIEIV